MNDNKSTITSLSLADMRFFFALFSFDEIHRLRPANKKKAMAPTKNKIIFDWRLIKKICEKPNASNQK